ncbi:MAG: hypothetical protein JSU92_14635 [Deltaproteobacteria bacterium]|nr:MAG: hypothetical protein JSU92_14635 [Deltaproteobacteria bacterium]
MFLVIAVSVCGFTNRISWAQDTFQSRQIFVEGAETITHNDIASARRSATKKTLQKAVERSLTNLVFPEIIAENYQLLIDQIFTQSSKYIREYKIVSDEIIGDIYAVKIEATVSLSVLKADLSNLGLLPHKGSKPKIMITIAEHWLTADSGQVPKEQIEKNLTVAEITAWFDQDGFIIIENPKLSEPVSAESAIDISSLNNETILRLGRESGADIIIHGKALTGLMDKVSGSTMFPAHATISIKSVKTETAKTICACTKSAVSIDISPVKARSEALKKAAGKLADRLIKDISDHWDKSQAIKTSAIQLAVSGISTHNDLLKLEKALQNQIQALQGIYLLSISPGTITLKLEVMGSTYILESDLINLLQSKEFPYHYELTQLP